MSAKWRGSTLVLLCMLCGPGCATHRTPAATIDLVSVAPAKNATVSKNTIVVPELAYSVNGFREGQFFVMAQLATTHPGDTFGGHEAVTLKEPRGTLTLSFPFTSVWDVIWIKRPFQVWFYLNERTGAGGSRVVAKTTPVDYETQ